MDVTNKAEDNSRASFFFTCILFFVMKSTLLCSLSLLLAAPGTMPSQAKFNVGIHGHTHQFAFHLKGELGNGFPVFIGGGFDMGHATVMIVEKSGPQLRITVKDTQGKVLLDRADF